ncbi:MAG: hypothetical protein ACTHMY_00580 [Solirubrobacteraceae bacterium]
MTERLHVGVDFDATEDPIAGWLTNGAERRPFTGWLGLISALEHAISDGGVADAHEDPQRGRDVVV